MSARVLVAAICCTSCLGVASAPAAILSEQGAADRDIRVTSRVDCGPQCLRFLSRYFQTGWNDEDVIQLCDVGLSGMSLKQLEIAAHELGLETQAFSGSTDTLKELRFPAILHCKLRDGRGHFIVVYRWDPHEETFLVFAPPDRVHKLSPDRLQTVFSGLGLVVSPTKLSSLGEAFESRTDWFTVATGAVLAIDLLLTLWVVHIVSRRRGRSIGAPSSAIHGSN